MQYTVSAFFFISMVLVHSNKLYLWKSFVILMCFFYPDSAELFRSVLTIFVELCSDSESRKDN